MRSIGLAGTEPADRTFDLKARFSLGQQKARKKIGIGVN